MSSHFGAGSDGVLRGNNNNQQNQGQPRQANGIANLMAMSNKLAGNINNQGGSAGGGLYKFSTGSNNYNKLLGLDDSVAEEHLKQQCLAESSQLSGQILNAIVRRMESSLPYRSFLQAKERFKRIRRDGPQEQILVDFINEVDSIQQLLNFIVVNASIIFASEHAQRLLSGDETIRSNPHAIGDVIYRACADALNLQFFDYLAAHPQGAEMFYRSSPMLKEYLSSMEANLWDGVNSRFIWAGGSIPWKKGRLSEIQHRVNQPNTLLESTICGELGLGGCYPILNENTGGFTIPTNQPDVDQDGMRQLIDYVAQTASKKRAEMAAASNLLDFPTEELSYTGGTDYNQIDVAKPGVEIFTFQTRSRYLLDELTVLIPGTEWRLMHEYKQRYVLPELNYIGGGNFNLKDVHYINHIAVFKFNWQEGTFEYKLIKHKIQSFNYMSRLLSNPSELLPYMYEEDGLQKTSFDPEVLETTKFNNNGKIITVEECADLEKEPNILIGNKPIKCIKGNEETIKTLDVLTTSYDPKKKLDGFVLPLNNYREWQVESTAVLDKIYEVFHPMVKDVPSTEANTSRVIKLIGEAINYNLSEEFNGFVISYLTNLVNRWLIEVRGYSETKEGNNVSYLKVGNIFTDIDDLIEFLGNNDKASLKEFINYSNNEYLRNGIQILAGRKELEEFAEQKYKHIEDEVVRSAMAKGSNNVLLLKRESIIFNFRKLVYPKVIDTVVVKKSRNPEIFRMIEKSVEITSKHYDRSPQILIKFEKDPSNKIWVATPCGIDESNVYVLRVISTDQDFVHTLPLSDYQ